jgi:XRE family transcriptional regulator, fatty acid utilization regulator
VNFAERIKNARTRMNLTLVEVKNLTGIGESSLSEFENGKREPSLSHLQILANTYKKSISFFFDESPVANEFILWRERPQVGAEKTEAHFLQFCEQYQNLEVWGNEKRSTCLPFVKAEQTQFRWSEAEELAKTVRNSLQLGNYPAMSLLSVLEEVCGVKVFHLDFEPTGTAASLKSGNMGAAVLLNSKNKRWRRNFDLAHELFHLLTWDVFSPNGKIAEADTFAWAEKLANSFASNLLLPAESVKTALNTRLEDRKLNYETIFDMAREFDVSAEALVFRISSLYRLKKEDTDKIIDHVRASIDSFETREDTNEPKYPERYQSLALKCLRRGEISLGRFAEYLDLSRHKAQQYLQEETYDDEPIEMPPA